MSLNMNATAQMVTHGQFKKREEIAAKTDERWFTRGTHRTLVDIVDAHGKDISQAIWRPTAKILIDAHNASLTRILKEVSG